jgi:hypothetical protein
MWKPLQRYRALDPEARSLFWRTVTLLPLISLSLRARGFNKTKEALQKKLPPNLSRKTVKNIAQEMAQKTCRMVRAGAHYGLGQPTCLVESLALWHLLQSQGIPAQLRIGVRKSSEKFEAHAWVEYEGVALNQADKQHQHYSAFDSGFSDLPGEKP